MELTPSQINELKQLMISSARKGNLANSGMVLREKIKLASAESLVVTNHDATLHSERSLVAEVCKLENNHYTPGLTMITVVEPCLMCMSACSQAGYKQIAFIIPADRYVEKIPWMTDNKEINKQQVARTFTVPLQLIHMSKYEAEFSIIFEEEMKSLLGK